MPLASSSSDPVPAVTEANASGATAELFADIRATLDVDVVNLIWRHLATMPGALEWAWRCLKPLYQGPAQGQAQALREAATLPLIDGLSADTLAAAGLDHRAVAGIRSVLDSYHHTNALALVAFSALILKMEEAGEAGAANREPAQMMERRTGSIEAGSAIARAAAFSASAHRATLPRLTPLSELPPPVARLVAELNRFGEDTDFTLLASMYRHLSHWPPYLALVRTLLVPLQRGGELGLLVNATRQQGRRHGETLVSALSWSAPPPESSLDAMRAIRRFVDHPIARMTALCALIRQSTGPG